MSKTKFFLSCRFLFHACVVVAILLVTLIVVSVTWWNLDAKLSKSDGQSGNIHESSQQEGMVGGQVLK